MPASNLPSRLPVSWTSFVGREPELADVRRLVCEGARLVTLVGTGGVGKTRLAMQVLTALDDGVIDAQHIVELAPLGDDALVVNAIANAIGIRDQPGQSTRETLLDRLRPRSMLLVLDNCEHVRSATAELVFALLQGCPGVSVLATSREPLGVPGEVLFRLSPLSTADAERLFVARSRAVRAEFTLTDRNAADIGRLVRRLDGLPLAIELAAARINALTPREILERLDDRFRLLGAASEHTDPRQHTLRAAVDWSFALLSDAERSMLARLSAFAGGWSLDAAAYVCQLEDAVDLLSRLVDRSLVQVEEDQGTGASRYRLLETVRAYASERLEEAGEAQRVRRGHAEFYLQLARHAEPALRAHEQASWLARLDREHDNLRAALRFSLDDGDATTALLIAGALGFFWAVRGHRQEGLGWLEAGLSIGAPATPEARSKALGWAGYLASELSDNDRAVRFYEESLRLRSELGDARGRGRLLEQYGALERRRGNYERATGLLEESLALRRELADEHGAAEAVGELGRVAWSVGDFGRAESLHEQAMQLLERLGDAHEAAHDRAFLAQASSDLGRFDRAEELFRRALESFRSMGDTDGMAFAQNGLAWLAAKRHRVDGRAIDLCRESLRLYWELSAPWGVVHALETAAACLAERGQPANAMRVVGAADALRTAIEMPLPPASRVGREAMVAAARTALGAVEADTWRSAQADRHLGPDEAAELARQLLEAIPTEVARHNLPAEVSRFIGRRRDVEEVRRLLNDGARVVTLTGTGGIGKTRLAQQVAHDLVLDYPDGVWLVELASQADPRLVPNAIALALEIRAREEENPVDAIRRSLRPSRALLVLDNCEHLLRECAELVAHLMLTCPRLQVLATSRQPLGIQGEVAWRVPPLHVPGEAPGQGSDEIGASEAVELFVERARAVVPGFALTDRNAQTIGSICRRLDGIPLAIELAAARAEALGLRQIAERLDDSLRLLTRGSRASLERHQTLRGALDWSLSLLEEPERLVLSRLSVFAGGWTLDAAEAICATPRVLDALAELVNASLVVATDHDVEVRFHLLEVVRQYAAELLRESGDEAAVRTRHLEWCLQLAERIDAGLRSEQQAEWLRVAETEWDNMRAAVRRSLSTGACEAGMRLLTASAYFCQIRGHLFRAEVRQALEHLLSIASELGASVPAPVRARALYWAGVFAGEEFDPVRAKEALEGSLRLWREIGDQNQTAETLIGLGVAARGGGDFARAEQVLTEAMHLARAASSAPALARALRYLGLIARELGDPGRAIALDRESLELFRRIGETHQVGHLLDLLGDALCDAGEYDTALRAHTEALATLRATGCEEGAYTSMLHRGRLAYVRGDVADALALACESLRAYQRLGVRRDVAGCLDLVALICAAYDPTRATRVFSAADAVRRSLNAPLPPVDSRTRSAALARLRATFGAEFERLLESGAALSLESAIEEALATQPPVSHPTDEPSSGAGPLSQREREVAELIAEGLSNREIAERLVIAPRTAEAHVTHVLSKLGLRSRSQVAVWVVNQSKPR